MNVRFISAACLLAATLTPATALEWEEQMVGDTMAGWEIKNTRDPVWVISNGVLTCTGERKGDGWFGTKEHYTDFALEFEFKLPPGGNSGVYLRAPAPVFTAESLEIQLLDDYADKHKNLEPGQYCGAIYKFCPPNKRVSNPAGEWNRMRITVMRYTIQVELNGVVVVDTERWQHPDIGSKTRRGAIGFQNYGDRVEFRKIRLADIAGDRDRRAQWFRDAKFGMFIHWGLYALHGNGEWHMNQAGIPNSEYEKLAAQFNPVKFNASEWVGLARRAGQKYMVVTSKHHDGFSMFDTKMGRYNIVAATPFARDPMKDLAAECAKQGVRFGFYHSILDWHHPDFTPAPKWDVPARQDHVPVFSNYMDYMQGQLGELCTGYGPLAVMWYDAGWHGQFPVYPTRMREINNMIRKLQPGILINGRCVIPGDFETPEQTVPTNNMVGIDGRPVPWESCMTLAASSWGYARRETRFKSGKDIVHLLADIVSKGGNLLLNVGPTPEGTIRPEETEALEATGRWLERHGESIYGTRAGSFAKLPFNGRITIKGNKLYVILLDWPGNGEIALPKLKNKIRSAVLLGDSGPAPAVTVRESDVLVRLGGKVPDAFASVVVLELDGEPVLESGGR